MNQREYVEGCLAWYREADLQPGNPEDGDWEECHYPAPKCLGGSNVILLLKQHHAVQGVLQSEEYQHPCIYGWELKYLEGELLDLGRKWKRISGTRAAERGDGIHAMTREEKVESGRIGGRIGGKISGKKTEEMGVGIHAQTREERVELGRNAVKMGTGVHALTSEERAAAVRLANAQVWESLIDGFRSNAGNVAQHNRRNGWDPKARVRVL